METWSSVKWSYAVEGCRALPPPPSHPSVEDLLVRGRGVFSLQGHIPLNRLPSFSSPSSILSLALLSFFVPTSSAPHAQLSPSLEPLFDFRHSLLPSPQRRHFPLSHSYLFFPFSSSSPRDPAPLQPCIIRPKHKPAQAHIWKEFGHGSFLPGRLNI